MPATAARVIVYKAHPRLLSRWYSGRSWRERWRSSSIDIKEQGQWALGTCCSSRAMRRCGKLAS
jgi:hypothetical protein